MGSYDDGPTTGMETRGRRPGMESLLHIYHLLISTARHSTTIAHYIFGAGANGPRNTMKCRDQSRADAERGGPRLVERGCRRRYMVTAPEGQNRILRGQRPRSVKLTAGAGAQAGREREKGSR